MNTPAPTKFDKSKLISGSITALLASGATTLSGQVTLGGAGFTVDNQTTNWDVDGDGHDDFQFIDQASTSGGSGPIMIRQRLVGLQSESSMETAMWMATDNGTYKISPFNTNVSVSTSQSFTNPANLTNNGALAAQATGFTDGGTHYIGFVFFRPGNAFYGWANITTNWGAGNSIVINEWAWNETANGAIRIGEGASAVPEPAAAATGLGLLALGAAGLRRQRWLKRNVA